MAQINALFPDTLAVAVVITQATTLSEGYYPISQIRKQAQRD